MLPISPKTARARPRGEGLTNNRKPSDRLADQREKKAQEQDDECISGDARSRSDRCLSMAEPFVMIRETSGKNRGHHRDQTNQRRRTEGAVQDIKLRIHDSHQYSCLVRNLSCAPNNTQNYEHRQDHHDEGQPPYTIDGHNRTKRSGTGIKKGCEQNSRNYNEEAGRRLLDEKTDGCA